MFKFRSILALALAFVMVLSVAFANPALAKAKKSKVQTYGTEQIAEIQKYSNRVAAMQSRLPELQKLIENQDWIFMRNFVHGPYGELRTEILHTAQVLFPDAKKQVMAISQDVAAGLVAVDRAGLNKDYRAAARGYTSLVKALDAYFSLIPQG